MLPGSLLGIGKKPLNRHFANFMKHRAAWIREMKK